MDSDSTTRLSASNSSRRFQSRSEAVHLMEEFEGDEELRPEFLCPFCAEDFDIVGLCCHIDEEHTLEAKNGICPVCAKRVGTDLISHITMQHGNLLKIQRKRRFRRNGGNSTFSILKKELREGNLRNSSSFLIQSSNNYGENEPWLSSFMSNTTPTVNDQQQTTQSPASAATSKSKVDTTNNNSSKRSNQQQATPLSDKDQQEKSRRSEFVQELLFSSFLDDGL